MGNATFFGFFFTKGFKKIHHLAFTEKVKVIKAYVPEKVILFIEKNLLEELKYFQKKYSFKIELIPDKKLIIPEYKIELINKSKKILNIVENINFIESNKRSYEEKKPKKETKKKLKKDVKKLKTKKKIKNFMGKKKKRKIRFFL